MLWLGHFLWPFLRITGIMLTAPILGSSMVPNMVKAILAAAYAAALAGWLPNLPAFPDDPFAAMYIGTTQLAFGAMIGMVMQVVISAVACAGEIAGLSMSLSFSELQFRDSTGSTPVLYDIMLWAGMIGFLVAGGPEWIFVALFHSFDNGVDLSGFTSWSDLAGMGEILFRAALCLALPVMMITLCINLTVGFTTVFAPQMNILSIGFPLLILAGIWAMSDSILYTGHVMNSLMNTGVSSIAEMARGRG